MTTQELAERIRIKNEGAYQEVDDSTLVDAWIKKYPVYADYLTDRAPESIEQEETPEEKTSGGFWDALHKTESVVGSIFPGRKVGQAIGTLGGYGLTAAQER